MTKKDTMCEQCTPAKRIVGANPEVNQQINSIENDRKIVTFAGPSSNLQSTKAIQPDGGCFILMFLPRVAVQH